MEPTGGGGMASPQVATFTSRPSFGWGRHTRRVARCTCFTVRERNSAATPPAPARRDVQVRNPTNRRRGPAMCPLFSVMLNRRGARHEPPGHPDTVALAPHVSDASGGVEGTVVHPLRATTSQRLRLPRQRLEEYRTAPSSPYSRARNRKIRYMYAGARGPAVPIGWSNDARVRSRAQRVANGRPPYSQGRARRTAGESDPYLQVCELWLRWFTR